MRVETVARTRVDLEPGKVPAHGLRGTDRGLDIVDREHKQLGVFGAGGGEQIQPRGVAIVDLVAEAAHRLHLLGAGVERGEGDVLEVQNAPDDLTHPAESSEDRKSTRLNSSHL